MACCGRKPAPMSPGVVNSGTPNSQPVAQSVQAPVVTATPYSPKGVLTPVVNSPYVRK